MPRLPRAIHSTSSYGSPVNLPEIFALLDEQDLRLRRGKQAADTQLAERTAGAPNGFEGAEKPVSVTERMASPALTGQ